MRDGDDSEIWSRVVADQAVIVTKDEDFILIAPTALKGPKILWVRTGNVVNRLLLSRFEQAWPEIETHLISSARVVELR